MPTYHVPPEMQGQTIERAFAGAGSAGAIQRITDRSRAPDHPKRERYVLHRWRASDHMFDPWNGDPRGVSCWVRGRGISVADAERLLRDGE